MVVINIGIGVNISESNTLHIEVLKVITATDVTIHLLKRIVIHSYTFNRLWHLQTLIVA